MRGLGCQGSFPESGWRAACRSALGLHRPADDSQAGTACRLVSVPGPEAVPVRSEGLLGLRKQVLKRQDRRPGQAAREGGHCWD